MDFRLDQSLVALGIDTVVVGIARNVDPQAVLPPSFLEKKKELEQWALQCQTEEVVASPVIKGYTAVSYTHLAIQISLKENAK